VVLGTVTVAQHERLELLVSEIHETLRASPAIFLAQALAKGDRDELAVQAATELGVDGVIPWSAARSVSRWEGAKIAKGRGRWAAVAREATKQSMRPWVPEILDLVSTKQLAQLAATARMLVLEPTAHSTLASIETDGQDLVVVVGPEGGIAPQELDAFAAAGASLVRLGDGVLRTSTAGPAAIAVLNVKLSRWG
jgi:16S rRNA (uracil1498-N3)-methyltransferase